ncbi:hypothetical protein [Pasteurella oralis]|uniref:hypothetical protein n=1 Tax=Pasteurella oralis TaxID=1071947 RepID=UPI000C7D3A08|nr:hypothetical protein [Pasteurella oralis]
MGYVDSTNGGWAEQEDRESRSRDSGRNNDSDNSYNRLEPDHPAYNPSGEQLSDNDREGWREHDSGNGYTSTKDRMNSHLNRYGRDQGYTNSFNSYSRSSISSVARAGRGSLVGRSQSEPRTLTGQKIGEGLLANMTQKYSAFNKSNYNPQGPMSRIPDPRNPNALNHQNFKYYEQLAEQDFIADKNRRTIGNTAGGMGASTAAEAVAGLIGGGAGRQIAGALTGLASSNAGGIANAVAGKSNRNDLNATQKAMYDSAYNSRDGYFKTKDGAFDTWDNAARSALGSAADIVTQNPLGTGSAIANIMNENAALEKTIKTFGTREGEHYLKEKRDKIRQAGIEDAKRRKEDEANQGILSTIISRANQYNSDGHKKPPYYAIPSIQNLWNNITVK